MYGSCFGANMLVFSLNGVVSRNPNNRYIVQAERLMMYDEFRHMMSAYPSLPSSSISASYQVLCTHEHHCSSLPNESVLLGSTPLCRNHAFVLGRHRNLLVRQEMLSVLIPMNTLSNSYFPCPSDYYHHPRGYNHTQNSISNTVYLIKSGLMWWGNCIVCRRNKCKSR